MYRIACLRIPRFQIAVHRKHEPGLKGRPLVLLSGKTNKSTVSQRAGHAPPVQAPGSGRGQAVIFMCSAEAHGKDIQPGMRLSEARALCADVLWREQDQKLYADWTNKLVRALVSCSPAVTAEGFGLFFMDASGLRHLGGEGAFCQNVLRLCSKLGFVEGNVGVADNAFAALVAARYKHRRWCIVPHGQDQSFLAPLSIGHLPASQDMQEALLALGIRSMGQLAGLPAEAIAERFGRQGLLARELACGLDRRRPSMPPAEKEFQASVDLGYPVASLNETLFVLKSMLDRLIGQLKQEGLRAEELQVIFFNDNERFDERPLKLICPSNNARFLLEILKLSLEAQPLKREFTGLLLAVSRFSRESWQQLPLSGQSPPDGLRKAGEQQSASILLLQRLQTRLPGAAAVRAVASDQYFPDNAGAWIPVLESRAASAVVPPDLEYIRNYTGARALAGGMVIKRAPEPVPVLVELEESRPAAVRYHGRWRPIKIITTPECLSGLWWESFIRKSYYVALLAGRDNRQDNQNDPGELLVLLAHDHQTGCWLLEGFFD